MSTHVDLTKLIVAVVAVIGLVIMATWGDLDTTAAATSITGIVMYILGNGSSIAQGNRPGTLLTRTDVRSRADDHVEG